MLFYAKMLLFIMLNAVKRWFLKTFAQELFILYYFQRLGLLHALEPK